MFRFENGCKDTTKFIKLQTVELLQQIHAPLDEFTQFLAFQDVLRKEGEVHQLLGEVRLLGFIALFQNARC